MKLFFNISDFITITTMYKDSSFLINNFFFYVFPYEIGLNNLPTCIVNKLDCNFCSNTSSKYIDSEFTILNYDLHNRYLLGISDFIQIYNYNLIKNINNIGLDKEIYNFIFLNKWFNFYYMHTKIESILINNLRTNLIQKPLFDFEVYGFIIKDNFYRNDFIFFFPFIYFFFFILFIFFYSIFLKNIKKILNINIITNCTIFFYFLLFFLFINMEKDIIFFKNYLQIDFFSFNFIFLLLNIIIIFHFFIKDYFKYENLKSYEYIIILNIAVFGLFFLIFSFDFLSLYLSLELQSLCIYILVAYKYFSNFSTEASLKYFILGAISSGFLLFGISLIYSLLGSTNFNNIYIILSSLNLNNNIDPLLIILVQNTIHLYNFELNNELLSLIFNYKYLYTSSLIFIICSFFFKLGLFPFHMWLPDVYQGSPTITTFFLIIGPKIALICIFIKIVWFCLSNINVLDFLDINYISYNKKNYDSFYILQYKYSHVSDYINGYNFYNLFFINNIEYNLKSVTKFYNKIDNNLLFLIFFIPSFFSIIIGSLGALRQLKIKRLLAYSSISHMGFIFINFINLNVLSLIVILIYILIYIVLNILFFSIYLSIRNKFTKNKIKNIKDFIYIYKNNKIITFIFILVLFSLAGIPPLMGFFSKFLVFYNLIDIFFIFLIVILFLSAISTYYYINIIKIILFDLNENNSSFILPTKSISYIIFFFFFLHIFFTIFPDIFFIFFFDSVLKINNWFDLILNLKDSVYF